MAVGLALTIGLLAVGCRQQKVASSSMSDEQQTALNTGLAELEATLKDRSPFIFARLAPAATDEELAALRAGLEGVQVQCLELWYQGHNGCSGHTTDILPLGRMLSISEALQDRRMIQGIPLVDAKRKRALKILEDGAGDGFFLDVASPTPRVFYHMLEDPFPRDYGSLQQLVTFINDVHVAGLASEKESGMVVFDLARYQELEVNYLRKIGSP